MKILFLCTAHNSLSQRLYLTLSRWHDVCIEYALSDGLIKESVALAKPDLIICPFLTSLVPKEVFKNYITLIIHPGPPGDVGPSALDWALFGDDGSVHDPAQLLQSLRSGLCGAGRTHWGVTVLQATEEFDTGPVWAFDQFPIDIDSQGLTKSELYRGPVTTAAVNATLAAISRIQAASSPDLEASRTLGSFPPCLEAKQEYRELAVTDNLPFLGGQLHHRPLLRAVERGFDASKDAAQHISRCIRCSDSQPGALSQIFGTSLYIYGGIIEDNIDRRKPASLTDMGVTVLGFRNHAVCISAIDGKGIWITHIRRPKSKNDKALWPKVPAVLGLLALHILDPNDVFRLDWPTPADWSLCPFSTFQDIWIEMQPRDHATKTAYLYFDFYNGAMATDQCSRLVDAMQYIISRSTSTSRVDAVVLMGGSYFSNGIALNVIEASPDPAMESWLNINRIDDVCHYLLHEFPSRNILTFAAIRGNAAAGGVALAAACDVAIAGSGVVLNPSYRAIGLHGSEGHTLSYFGRCGKTKAKQILQDMMPMSPYHAQSIGLVDFVFPGAGPVLDDYIKSHISFMLKPGLIRSGSWKAAMDLSRSALARARANELAEMSLDFWSARSVRFHERRFAFVRKLKPKQTPLRFATHRRRNPNHLDEEELPSFDEIAYYKALAQAKVMAIWRKTMRFPDAPQQTSPLNITLSPQATYLERPNLFPCYYGSDSNFVSIPVWPLTPEMERSPSITEIDHVHLGTSAALEPNPEGSLTFQGTSTASITSCTPSLAVKGMTTPPLSPLTPGKEVDTLSYF